MALFLGGKQTVRIVSVGVIRDYCTCSSDSPVGIAEVVTLPAAPWVALGTQRWPFWTSLGQNNSWGYSCCKEGSEWCSRTVRWAIPHPNPWQVQFALPAPATLSEELLGFQHFGKLETNPSIHVSPLANPDPSNRGPWGAARCSSVCSP